MTKQKQLQRIRAATVATSLILASEGVKPAGSPLRAHGEVCFANESRFNEAHFQQPLTTYAVGWKPADNLEEILHFLAPRVEVPHKFEYAEAENAEMLLSETDDERPIGGDFKSVDYTEGKIQAKVANRGLTMRIDRDQVSDKSDWEVDYTNRLLQRCMRNEYRRAVTLASAAAVNTAKTWDTTAGKHPDQDIKTELITAADIIGIRPNRVLFGETAWDKRGISYGAQNNAAGYAHAGMSPEQVASQLMVSGVKVSKERYQSSASAKSQIVNNLVLMFMGMDGATTDDPSSLKRFVAPTQGGTFWRVYRHEEGVKIIYLTVEYYSLIKVTSTLGIRKFTVS